MDRIRSPKSLADWSRVHSRGFRTSDSQRNVMAQSTEMSPLVSMLFWTFLNPLKSLMEIFNILYTVTVPRKCAVYVGVDGILVCSGIAVLN